MEEPVVKMIFGSHLYGTATEESDMDYKGIFASTQDSPKSVNESTNLSHNKNSANDVDMEWYSLHYFIKLACEGQTVALDMLHAPDWALIETSPTWEFIVANRERFYTRNLDAFVGYARKQASKYGVKGSRLAAARAVIEFLEAIPDKKQRMVSVWNELPKGEHIFKDALLEGTHQVHHYQVCGRNYQSTARIEYVLGLVQTFFDQYGERAKQAEKNDNVDWKAISHAMRAALQVKELLTEKNITFPLKEAELLSQVKQGRLDYKTQAEPYLEALMEAVEELSAQSNLPEQADLDFWNAFLDEIDERAESNAF